MNHDQKSFGAAADLELERRVWAAFTRYHVASLRNIKLDVRDGKVALRGEVHSFYAKQLLQHCARRVAGDDRVVDEVNVVTPVGYHSPTRWPQVVPAGAVPLADRN